MSRRVVKGPQDSKQQQDPSKYSPPGTSRQNLQSSIDDALNQMQADELLTDIDQSKHDSVLDQYSSIGDGGRILSAKSRPGESRTQTQPQSKPRIDRQRQISDLMSKYESATKESARRKGVSGLGAVSMSLSNPAAGAQYAKAYEGYNNAPVDAIVGGQKSSLDQVNINKGVSAQTQTDDEMDPNSNLSKQHKALAEKYLGRPLPQNITSADLKKLLPFISFEGKKESVDTGNVIRAETEDQNRKQREDKANADRITKQAIANNRNITAIQVAKILSDAGIDRVVAQQTIKQNFKTGTGGRGGRVSDSAGLTYPNMSGSSGQNKFLTRDPSYGAPTQGQKTRQDQLQNQFTKYSGALNDLLKYMQDFKDGKTDYSIETVSNLLSQYEMSVESAVKAFGDGVANGPDLVQMKKIIGDPNSLLGFISGGNMARAQNARRAAEQGYLRVSKSNGYIPSKQSHPGSKMTFGGSGGTSASGNVYDPTDTGNEALRRHGLPPLQKTQPGQPSPQTPPIPSQQPIDKKTDDALKAMGF